MKLEKMLLTYEDGKTFGIEVDANEASNIVINWFKPNGNSIGVEGYDIDPKHLKKIEFFK